ncbi:MAG: IS110 family transposase [Gemmatimonadales bacterium]
MKRTTKYVGLDVHQASTVASVREEGGRVIARSVLPTDGHALTEFVRGMRGAVHLTFEEGTQAQWVHDLLAPLVDRVVVCDRRGAPRQGNKGDQVDADALSELLRRGGLRAVYHGSAHHATLKELTRTYRNLVEDATRVMLRLKAVFRARAIATRGTKVYQVRERAQWLAQLAEPGARFRAQVLYAELDRLRALRPKVKAAMLAEARRDPAWAVLRTIPYLGPVRVALLLATMGTPWRFRTKRQLWAYAGLAVVTHSSADYLVVGSQVVRRRRAPRTRGLNRNHNRVLKDVFKSAATAATARPGPLQEFYHRLIAQGMRPELARVTLTRKLAALTLRLWKRGERYDPTQLTTPAR